MSFGFARVVETRPDFVGQCLAAHRNVVRRNAFGFVGLLRLRLPDKRDHIGQLGRREILFEPFRHE